ncbi:MAG: hypothetical protein KC656_08695, partial [Myxococcales bacterium]|nr:hypothetical protein [Myxococcales bacterium]
EDEEAIEVLKAAVVGMERLGRPRRAVNSRYNLVFALAGRGRFAEAREVCAAIIAVYREADDVLQLHRSLELEATMAGLDGDPDAEARFASVAGLPVTHVDPDRAVRQGLYALVFELARGTPLEVLEARAAAVADGRPTSIASARLVMGWIRLAAAGR